MFCFEKSSILCYVTAPKEEKDDEDWSRGHRKTEKESETRTSSFEDLGDKFENASLTNTPFHSTHSPESKSHHTKNWVILISNRNQL